MASFPPTAEQQECIDAAESGDNLVVRAYAGCGKALRNDQPVLTPMGFAMIGDLCVGDLVIGRDGLPYPITGVYPQGIREMYRIALSDRTEIVADSDHIWTVQRSDDRRSGRTRNVTTMDLYKKPRMSSGPSYKFGDGTRAYWWIPMCSPVEFGVATNLPMDPWLLGVLIGDGAMTSGLRLSSADKDIVGRVENIVQPEGGHVQHVGSGVDYAITFKHQTKPGHRGLHNPFVTTLRTLGLWGKKSHQKFIPHQYLTAPVDQRVELLRGLMDADGYAETGRAEFSTTSHRLSEGIRFIVQSLGGTDVVAEKIPTLRGKKYRKAYRHTIKLPDHINPFWLSRKADVLGQRQREPYRTVVSVERIAPAKATCISVASPDRLFLTKNFVPTHNTTTLTHMANAIDSRQIYLAFNKSIVKDAEKVFPDRCKPMTLHGMAFRDMRDQYLNGPHGVKKMTGNLNAGFVSWKMNMRGRDLAPGVQVTARGWAFLVTETVKRWMRSGASEIAEWCVPIEGGLKHVPEQLLPEIKAKVVPVAKQLWHNMIDPTHELPLSHDGYLKLFCLQNPQLPCDTLYVDEAQDLNGIVVDLVKKQKCQVILVGDAQQQIYEWRGAQDALDKLGIKNQARLSQSFRFSEELAENATQILELLGETVPLRGNPAKSGGVAFVETPDTILNRTNAGVIDECLFQLGKDRQPVVVGGVKEVISVLKAVQSLQNNQPVEHPEFFGFANWGEVQDISDKPEGKDLKRWVRLVENHGVETLMDMLDGLPSSEKKADVLLSTGHKAKGREWGSVKVAGDFLLGVKTNKHSDTKQEIDHTPEATPAEKKAELRLLYVACTRAMEDLDMHPDLDDKLEVLGLARS